ncbi:UDP-N-acetylmuramate dehydrogenase [Limimaricola cinnabarinus]|uniref:UDP-N-acetylmuramate dehydrogenase n=1 Tax=Limimaricola cinnabarinus TaxID=1125964 RepID=UPI002FE31682
MTRDLDLVATCFEQIARRDMLLKELSRWQIGGPAELVLSPRSAEELGAILRLLNECGLRYAVVGDGSNILFDDSGYRGVILRIGSAFSKFELHQEGQVTAGAGLWVPDYTRRVIRAGLSGCVHAIGIPGRLGGLIAMNGGSQRRGIGENLVKATVVRTDGEIITLDQEACNFSYRSSRMQKSGDIVIEASFSYEVCDVSSLRREALAILIERNRKFPRKLPNCGSVFLSNPKMYDEVGPPGRAIEQVGLKGYRYGGAQLSLHHANFIVNNGSATSSDILALIALARRRVADQTGYFMDCEVRYLEPEGAFRMAHEVA